LAAKTGLLWRQAGLVLKLLANLANPPLSVKSITDHTVTKTLTMTMTQQESLALVRQLLGAKDDDELTQIIGLNLGRIDGTFFGVLNASVKQLEREGKPGIAQALQDLGDRMLRMKTLI